jgi:flagellar FliJ protein
MYRFRLQRLLDYRHRRAERLAEELHLAQQRWRHEQAQLEALLAERQALQQRFEATQGNTLLNEELKLLHLAHHSLRQRIEAQEAVLAQMNAALAAKQQALVRARQEEKTMEKLRAKQEQRHVLEHSKREQGLIDDVAITRFRHAHTAITNGNAQS